MMAHRGLDRAVEIVEIVGLRGGQASECEDSHAAGVLEQGDEALHIRQHSEIAAGMAALLRLAVNST